MRPIVVHGTRIRPEEVLDRLPGQTHVVDLAPLRDRIATTSEALERVPGLHVSDYGGLGAYSTVSIRGSSAGQVSVYLDGVPLGRAGLGVENLADLPFAGLDRIEVYRGFAPVDFPGSGPGGAINLVTRGGGPKGSPLRRSGLLAGGGSYGTSRLGASHEFRGGGWSGLAVADLLSGSGDFTFLDDNGTPLDPRDDALAPRQNNWMRGNEFLLRFGRALGPAGELTLLNSWVEREHGVPGIPSDPALHARTGTAYDVTSAEVRWAGLAGLPLGVHGRLSHEWRRDTFADPESEVGLLRQDERDVTREWGGHLGLRASLPLGQAAGFEAEVGRETFLPARREPSAVEGPEQVRRTLLLGVEDRIQVRSRLEVTVGLRFSRAWDEFAGDLRNAYSRRPAVACTRSDTEPRIGARLALPRGFTARASGGQYHRAPGFLELFGDGGSVAGSSDLVPESGVNRDFGLQWDGGARGTAIRLMGALFRNRVEHWITFIPQSQSVFVARNIGSATLQGDEWSWRIADARSAPRWALEGDLLRLDARDLGVDISWYAGKTLPGRPARELHQRASLRLGRVELGYDYEHLGRNYLDRWNSAVVARRDLHGLDLRSAWRGMAVQFGLRNLTGAVARDVANFPLPGRTFFMTLTYTR